MIKSIKIGIGAVAVITALTGTLAFKSPMGQFVEKVCIVNSRYSPVQTSDAAETALIFQQTVTLDAEHQTVTLGPIDVRRFRQLRLAGFHVSGGEASTAYLKVVSSTGLLSTVFGGVHGFNSLVGDTPGQMVDIEIDWTGNESEQVHLELYGR